MPSDEGFCFTEVHIERRLRFGYYFQNNNHWWKKGVCKRTRIINSLGFDTTDRPRFLPFWWLSLRGGERVQYLFLFPLVLGKIQFSHAKLRLFLRSLDNLLQENVNSFFFVFCFLFCFFKSNVKMALIWKKGLFLTYFSHF